MANITAVGIATLDIINTVDGYPIEDDEVRATAQRIVRGGNATNTLVVLTQLGHRCGWAGVIADEPDGARILADLQKYAIDLTGVKHLAAGKVPTSYVALNARNGSRTIIHYRDLPEFGFDDFASLDLGSVDWLHFEGRNVGETFKMMSWIRQQRPELPISLEIEKPRYQIESLLLLADVILFSRAYAHHCGFRSGPDFLAGMRPRCPKALLVCSWGSDGAYAAADEVWFAPAYPPPRVVDTLGAGDTFNAGLIHGLVTGLSPAEALDGACRLAGRKCGMLGFDLELPQ